MKVLWVKSGGLLPLDTGGKIRSYSIARELASRHEVTLFTFYPAITPDPHDRLTDEFDQVETLPLNSPNLGSVSDSLVYAANALTRRPYQARKYCRPEAAAHLRRILARTRYDLLLCDFMLTAGVLPAEIDIPTVVFTHNVEAIIWRRRFEVSRNPASKLVAWREYHAIRRMERHVLSRSDHVLTVSEGDREAFLEFLPETRVTSIPTGVDLDYFRPDTTTKREKTSLVFTGSMDWSPNEDAILYFTLEILPRIQAVVPNITLEVVGRRPTPKLRALDRRNPAIKVTGEVDDVRPYVSRANVYVVPIRIGGGTRIKIFEAMAMGMPIVSTSVGAEGLPVRHHANIILSDTPDDFARCVVDLLRSEEKRQKMGRAARALVEKRYGWKAVTDVVDEALQAVLTGSVKRSDTIKRSSTQLPGQT